MDILMLISRHHVKIVPKGSLGATINVASTKHTNQKLKQQEIVSKRKILSVLLIMPFQKEDMIQLIELQHQLYFGKTEKQDMQANEREEK